jgi:ADP-heptose:LPS heptosyltransferase
MVVFEDNRFIVDVLGVIPLENVLTIASDSFFNFLRSGLTVVARLRSLKIDAGVDLEFFARSSAILTCLTGAPVRSGFHAYFGEGPYRGKLMTHRVRYNPHLHTTQIFDMLVDAIDVPRESFPRYDLLPQAPDESLPSFTPTAQEIAVARELIERFAGVPATQRLILLNANASDLIPLRRWSTERYIELARRLLDHFPETYVAFTGGPGESAASEMAVREAGSQRCFSLAGHTTLRQLLVLYGLADVLVTNDSGPAHFASLTSIQSVTLFGPETPLLFADSTPRNTALWAGIACSPCVSALNNRRSACTNNVCMQRIAVDQVFDAVCASYQRAGANREAIQSAQQEHPRVPSC